MKSFLLCSLLHFSGPFSLAPLLASQANPRLLPPLVYLEGGTTLYLSTSHAAFLAGRSVFSLYDIERLESFKYQILTEDLLTTRIRFGDQLTRQRERVPGRPARCRLHVKGMDEQQGRQVGQLTYEKPSV